MRGALLFVCACASAQESASTDAPIGTRVGAMLRTRVSLVNVSTRTELSTPIDGNPLAIAYAAGAAGNFLLLSDKRLLGWSGTSGQPEHTFALTGFVPSGVVGARDAAIVFSRDASSTWTLALWHPESSDIKRIAAFNDGTRITACVCQLGSHWLAVGSAVSASANDQIVLVDASGDVAATYDFSTNTEGELRGAAGCVANGDEAAIVFSASANMLVLRYAGSALQQQALLPLPAGFSVGTYVTPAYVNGAIALPARTGEEVALLNLDGSSPVRLRFAGAARAVAALGNSLLVGVVGETSRLVLHFFDGRGDETLFEWGAGDILSDLVVARPEE